MKFLRYSAAILISIFSCSLALAQFAGGNADGHAHLRLTNVTCSVVNANPFTGGASDGHANARIANVVCSVVNANPFSGGNADGHANQRIVNVVCPVINANPYSGGMADGHSNLRLENEVCIPINVNPYFGGEADGHTNLRLTNVSVVECEELVLPIELLSFNAITNGQVVDIHWTTSSEINNDFFTVERSDKVLDFQSLLRIEGAGNSTQLLKYTAVDSSPYPGVNYYRLKQTDFDGKFSYSNIVSIDFESLPTENQLYPNPNDGKRFYVKIPNTGYRNVQINIQSVDGKVLLSETVYVANTFEFSPSVKLTSGVYLISISDNFTTHYHSLLVK